MNKRITRTLRKLLEITCNHLSLVSLLDHNATKAGTLSDLCLMPKIVPDSVTYFSNKYVNKIYFPVGETKVIYSTLTPLNTIYIVRSTKWIHLQDRINP